MLNEHQQAYVDMLNKMKAHELCWCGWYKKGECPRCPGHVSAADKLKARCSECGSAPHNHGANLYHQKGCSHRVDYK